MSLQIRHQIRPEKTIILPIEVWIEVEKEEMEKPSKKEEHRKLIRPLKKEEISLLW